MRMGATGPAAADARGRRTAGTRCPEEKTTGSPIAFIVESRVAEDQLFGGARGGQLEQKMFFALTIGGRRADPHGGAQRR